MYFHGDEALAVDLAHLVELAAVGMVDRGSGLRFPEEAPAGLVIVLQARRQKLEGDLATQAGVLGEKHLSHATLAELAQDSITGDRLADHSSPS